jgi:hypothetical protein
MLIKYTTPDHGDYDNLLEAQYVVLDSLRALQSERVWSLTGICHCRRKIVDVAQWVDTYKSNNDMMADLSQKITGMGVVRWLVQCFCMGCGPLILSLLCACRSLSCKRDESSSSKASCPRSRHQVRTPPRMHGVGVRRSRS